MRPPACVSCKWGTGTVCERPSDTAAAKEVKTKLEQMMAERAKQDAKWFGVSVAEQKYIEKKSTNK